MAINLCNHRFLYVFAFLLLCASVGSAETVGNFVEYDSNQWTYTQPGGSKAGGDYTNSWLYMRDISYHTDGLQFVSEVVPYANFIGTLLPTYESYYENINLTESGIYVASGRMGYYNMSGEGKVKIWLWVDVDTWNTSYVGTLSGEKYLTIVGMTSAYYDTNLFVNSYNVGWSGNDYECFFAGVAGPAYNYDYGDYNVQSQVYFNNEYHYSVSNDIHTVEVLKTVDGVVSPSLVTVNNSDGFTLASDGNYNVIDFYMQDNNLSIPYQLIVTAETTGTVHSVYLTAPDLDENTIEWGSTNYTVDDTGSYTWYLSDANWDTWLYSKKASIYKDEILLHEVSLPSQIGTFYYTFDEEGNYVVKLRHTSLLLPHKTIDTDTTTVTPQGDSYIHVNSSIATGEHFDITFSFGYTPGNYLANGVQAKYLDENTNKWLYEKQWTISDLYPMTANTLYNVSGTHTIDHEGSYIFELYDFIKGTVATTPIITATLSSSTPTQNISTSYLNISKESYVMGEILEGFYGIDNTNYSFNNYLRVYSYDYDTTTMDFPLVKQSNPFYGIIVQTDQHSNWLHEGEIPALPGNNKIAIYGTNSTVDFEIVHVNFTVTAYDEDGYGLQLSAYEACINDEVLISVITPCDANLTIFTPTGLPVKTYTLNGSKNIKYYFPTTGMYSIELYKYGEGISRATATILINECVDDGIIIPPSDGDMDDMYQNMFDFMTIPAFWGILIILGFVGGIAMKTNRAGDRLVSGPALAFITFALINLFAIVGLFAPYTMYILVSTWIFAGMFFGVGKLLAKGE